jgi:DNA sulfur modification protein DndB
LPALEAAKRRNVRSYVQYLIAARNGRDPHTAEGHFAVAPPIILWSVELLSLAQMAGGVAVLLPHDTQLEVLDGRTQTAAWHEIGARYPDKRKVLVPVVIHHGRSPEWARRAFRDIHTLAIKPNTTVESLDGDDPISLLTKQIEDSVELFKGRVSRERQVGSRSGDVVTLSTLRTACATFALGISGVQKTVRPADAMSRVDEHYVLEQATRWFGAITDRFEQEFLPELRRESVLPSPAAMAAVGAFGNPLIEVHGAAVEDELGWRIRQLAEVDWRRGEHWGGIAGEITADGTLSLGGGARERAYKILRALEDRDSDEYQRVRNQQNVGRTR